MKKINTKLTIHTIAAFAIIITFQQCDDFVQVGAPRTELVQKTVFADDGTAEAAMVDIYYAMKTTGFASGSPSSISLLASYSSDEQNHYSSSSSASYLQFNNNELQPNNQFITRLWSEMYRTIFKANSIIEGLAASNGVTVETRERLTGEAQFIRAFCHFYLVNLWGDVPLILTTDYKVNDHAGRTPVAEVYDQILIDLKEAATSLPEDYSVSKGERVRANKWAATALLARVYLYTKQWAEAEATASLLIDNTTLFALEPDLLEVFRGTSPEAILQWWSQVYPADANSFAVYSFGPLYGAMRPEYVVTYEPDDQRWAVWGRNVVAGTKTYPCYFKYNDFSTPPLDYSTVFRLAEQYLIRAEARLRQLKLQEAQQDINAIRKRAGLEDTSSSSEDDLLDDVINERKAEFATEWGHRWFDLKRWDKADEILGPLKPTWSANDALYPIPESQIIANPSMQQNP